MGNVRPFPVLASFEITDKWRDAPSGGIPAPAPDDVSLGNHTVLLVGYDDSRAEFKFQNSWGEDWGDGGFGTVGYETFEATCWEAWVWDFIGARDDTPKEPAGFRRGDWGLRDHAGGMFHCRNLLIPTMSASRGRSQSSDPKLWRSRNFLFVQDFGGMGTVSV
jgi:hypothetical protein